MNIPLTIQGLQIWLYALHVLLIVDVLLILFFCCDTYLSWERQSVKYFTFNQTLCEEVLCLNIPFSYTFCHERGLQHYQ